MVLGSLVAAAPARATVLLSDPNTEHLDLGATVDSLQDPQGLLSDADVRRPEVAARFAPIGPGGLSKGYDRSAWWLRLVIENRASASRAWVLSVPWSRLDDVRLFRDQGHGIEKVETGLLRGWGSRELPDGGYAFPVDLPQGKTATVWLRVQSLTSPVYVPVHLWRADAYNEIHAFTETLLGGLLGLLLAMLVYRAVALLRASRSGAGWLQIYLVGLAVAILSVYGRDIEWLWPNSPRLASLALPAAQVLCTLGSWQFTRTFIRLPQTHPRMDRALTWAAALSLLCNGTAMVWPPARIMADQVGPFFAATLVLVCMPSAFAGVRSARWLAAMWLPTCLSYGAITLMRFGLLSTTGDGMWGALLGSASGLATLLAGFADAQIETLVQLRRNVAERERDEKALAASEARFRAIADHIPGILYQAMADPDHTTTYVSHGGANIVAFDDSLPHSTPLRARDTTHPDDWPRVLAQQEEAIRAGRPFQVQYRVRFRDGSIHTMLDTGALREDGPGGMPIVDGFVQDVTELVHAQEALASAKEAAEAANLSKSAFLANVSHEIRTPMNAILGFADLLAGQVAEPQHRRFADAIRTSGRSLLALINDILDLSKIEAGKVELRLGPVNLRALVSDMEQVFAQKAEEKGLVLRSHIADEVPAALQLDEVRMRQVLLNLVGNAVKFTDRGHVEIRVGVRRDASAGTWTLQLEVSDTGIGIAQDQLTRIFAPFEQQAGQDHARYGGTGLGLAITSRLCELMGGSVGVQTAQGQGSTFTVTIDGVRRGAPSQVQAATPLRDYHFEPARVLAIDDEPNNLELIVAYLQGTGLEVEIASGGAEGLAKARQLTPHVVLTDIKMPVMDGFALTRALRSDLSTAAIPVVAVTATVEAEVEEKVRAVCDGHVRKPVTRAMLLAELAVHLPHRLVGEPLPAKS